jgi:hypothetical protein
LDLAPLRALRAYNRCADPKASEQIAQLKAADPSTSWRRSSFTRA